MKVLAGLVVTQYVLSRYIQNNLIVNKLLANFLVIWVGVAVKRAKQKLLDCTKQLELWWQRMTTYQDCATLHHP